MQAHQSYSDESVLKIGNVPNDFTIRFEWYVVGQNGESGNMLRWGNTCMQVSFIDKYAYLRMYFQQTA